MILLIDNYDSFSYNLVQMAGSINPDIKVIRNDELTVEEIENLHPDKIILSPGPGYPKDAVCVKKWYRSCRVSSRSWESALDIRRSAKPTVVRSSMQRN